MSIKTLLEAANFVESSPSFFDLNSTRDRISHCTYVVKPSEYPFSQAESVQHSITQSIDSIYTQENSIGHHGPSQSNDNWQREAHNQVEKNRRAHLKDCFAILKRSLGLSDSKASNLRVLHSAMKYMKVLERKERELVATKCSLKNEAVTLNARFADLRHSLMEKNILFDKNILECETISDEDTKSISTETADEDEHLLDDVECTLPPNGVVGKQMDSSQSSSNTLHSSIQPAAIIANLSENNQALSPHNNVLYSLSIGSCSSTCVTSSSTLPTCSPIRNINYADFAPRTGVYCVQVPLTSTCMHATVKSSCIQVPLTSNVVATSVRSMSSVVTVPQPLLLLNSSQIVNGLSVSKNNFTNLCQRLENASATRLTGVSHSVATPVLSTYITPPVPRQDVFINTNVISMNTLEASSAAYQLRSCADRCQSQMTAVSTNQSSSAISNSSVLTLIQPILCDVQKSAGNLLSSQTQQSLRIIPPIKFGFNKILPSDMRKPPKSQEITFSKNKAATPNLSSVIPSSPHSDQISRFVSTSECYPAQVVISPLMAVSSTTQIVSRPSLVSMLPTQSKTVNVCLAAPGSK